MLREGQVIFWGFHTIKIFATFVNITELFCVFIWYEEVMFSYLRVFCMVMLDI